MIGRSGWGPGRGRGWWSGTGRRGRAPATSRTRTGTSASRSGSRTSPQGGSQAGQPNHKKQVKIWEDFHCCRSFNNLNAVRGGQHLVAQVKVMGLTSSRSSTELGPLPTKAVSNIWRGRRRVISIGIAQHSLVHRILYSRVRLEQVGRQRRSQSHQCTPLSYCVYDEENLYT